MTNLNPPIAWSDRLLFSTTLSHRPHHSVVVTAVERGQDLERTYVWLAISDGQLGTMAKASTTGATWSCHGEPILATWPGAAGGAQIILQIEALLDRFGAPGGEEVIMHAQRRAFRTPAIDLLLRVIDELEPAAIHDDGEQCFAILQEYRVGIESVRAAVELGRGMEEDVKVTLRNLREGLRHVEPLTLPEMVGIHDRVKMAHYAPTAMLPRALATLLGEMLAEDSEPEAQPADPREVPVTDGALAVAQALEKAQALVLVALAPSGWEPRGPAMRAGPGGSMVRLRFSAVGPEPKTVRHPLTGVELPVVVAPVRIGAKNIDTPCLDVLVTDAMLQEHGQ